MINLITNERLAAWSFSSLDSADPEAEITCLSLVSGVSGDPRSNNPTHVILGLDTGLHGALAVFDITEGLIKSLYGSDNNSLLKIKENKIGHAATGYGICFGPLLKSSRLEKQTKTYALPCKLH